MKPPLLLPSRLKLPLLRQSLLLLLLGAAACEPPTLPPRLASEVYEFRLPTPTPLVLRWPSGAVVRVHVHGGAQSARAQLLEDAFSYGAALWNAQAFYAEYRLERATSVADADVVLRWSDEPSPVATTLCPPTITRAVTTFCLDTADPQQLRLRVFPQPGPGPAGRVRMLVTILGTEAVLPERVTRLVAHELGHVLGIARHSLNEQDLMYGGEILRPALSIRDAATVQVLYHSRPDVVP